MTALTHLNTATRLQGGSAVMALLMAPMGAASLARAITVGRSAFQETPETAPVAETPGVVA